MKLGRWLRVSVFFSLFLFVIGNQGQSAPLAFGVSWSPDGTWIGVSSLQGAWFYQADDLRADPIRYLQESQVSVIAYNGTGTQALMPGDDNGRDNFVTIVNLEEHKVGMAYYAPPPPDDGFSVYYDMRFSADDQKLIVGNASALRIFDIESELETASYDFNSNNGGWVTGVALTTEPDRYLATNWGSNIHIFDEGSNSITQFRVADELTFYDAIHLDGTTYLLLADQGIFYFDTETGDVTLIEQPISERVTGFALSSDRQLLATGSANQWVLYDLEADEVRLNKQIDSSDSDAPFVFSLAFNEDGTQLVTQQVNGMITIWDTATGEAITSIDDFDRAVSYRWG